MYAPAPLPSFPFRFGPANEGAAPDAEQALPNWDLTHIYAGLDAPQVQADMEEALNASKAFEMRYKGKLADLLGESGDVLAESIVTFERLQDLYGKLISYAGLSYFGNTTDPDLAKFYGDVQERLTAASAHLLFYSLELNALDDQALEAAMETSAALGAYGPWLTDLRKDKPFQLDEKSEQIFHEKSVTGAAAWNRLFDETMADLRFSVEGTDAPMPLEPTLNLLTGTDGEKRKAASAALDKVFKENARVFTLITNTLAKDKEISDRWRGFEDIADSRHLANRVERDVVNALVEAVEAAYPKLSHRYYKLKAKWFGQDALDYWDRNAPLPDVDARTFTWDEARDTVLDAYGAFSPDMAAITKRFFDENWIDAEVRPGKASGAFAHPTVPSLHPYVLVNYQGKPRDVMTLAHELGHGVHQVLAGKQGALMAPTPLTLAETASVFGEMLTFRSLLEKTTDTAARKALIAGKVEDMLNTVVRQIAFYAFERAVHTERRKGELTAEQLNALWMSIQGKSLGPAIRLDEGYETFWSYIPHFVHSPFYVYAYAFGDCLVNSLYAVYQNAEEGFVTRYFDLLSAGGSKHHSDLLAPFGLDARDPQFWSEGLSVIAGLIDELEAMEEA